MAVESLRLQERSLAKVTRPSVEELGSPRELPTRPNYGNGSPKWKQAEGNHGVERRKLLSPPDEQLPAGQSASPL